MFCQWNEQAEDDLRQFGLNKDFVDDAVKKKFRNDETYEFDRIRGTRAARFAFKGKRYLAEFTIEPENNRPWIQAVELEPIDL
jgi:hypothetical protein